MKKQCLRFVSVVLSVMIIMTTFSIIPTFAAETEVAVVGIDDSRATGYKQLDESELPEDIDLIGSIEDYYKVIAKETGESTTYLKNTLNLSEIDEVDNSKSEYFPPIGNQGSLNSCTTWACGYYQFTYEMNRKMQRAIDPEKYESYTFSPTWLFNALNGGANEGVSPYDVYKFLKTQGCVTLEDLPYNAKNYDCKTWSPSEELWTKSLDYRLKDYNEFNLNYENNDIVVNEGTEDKDIQSMKAALANGEVLTFASCIDKWKCVPMTENDNYYIAIYMEPYTIFEDSTHMMTIVGYDDNIWTDINRNGSVDAGEKGAFKIANSWGESWKDNTKKIELSNDGFIWVAYDALNKVSAVNSFDNTIERMPIFEDIFRITVQDYNSDSNINLVYTLNSSDRTETKITIKADDYEEEIEPYDTLCVDDICKGLSYDGAESANDGTMAYGLDNVIPNLTSENFKEYEWTVTVRDTEENDNELIIKNLKIIDENTNTVYVPVETFPQELNGDNKTYTFEETKVATIYYRGYYNPCINYKINDEVSSSYSYAQMNNDYTMQGYTQKFQIYLHDDAKTANVAFTDGKGNIDDNDGKYYTVRAGVNFIITENADIPDLSIDASSNDFDSPVSYKKPNHYSFSAVGGYSPYKYEFSVAPIDNNEESYYLTAEENTCSIFFYKVGIYNLYVDVTDQAGNTARKFFVINAIDKNVEVASFEASEAYTDKAMTFTAKTQYESVSSNNKYSLEIKKDGVTIAEPTVTCIKSDTINRYTELSSSWTPTEIGDYTATISVTDEKGIPATKTIDFSVEASELALAVTSTSTTGSVNINTQQIFYLNRTGGYGPYSFNCVSVNTTTGKFDSTIGKTSNGYSVYFRSVGTHRLTFTVTDNKGNKATAKCTVVVNDNPVKFNTFTISNNYINKPISFKATTLYEAMSYPIANTVTLTIKKGDNVVATPTVKCTRNISQLTSTFTASWTPTESGSYSATITIKDYYGRTASKTINFTPTLAISYASNDFTTHVNINTAQTYKFDTIGGYGPYTYTYTCYNMTKSTYDASIYTTSTGCTIYYRSAGRHRLTVKTTDSKGNTKTYYFYPTVEDNHVELTSFNKTASYVGGEITFTATTRYEAMLYQIANNATLTIKKNDDVIATPIVNIKSKNMSTLCSTYTANWTPTVEGNYTATLVVTDYYGRKAEKTISFTVNPSLYINSFEISPSTNLGIFENITMKATASGGAAGYRYKYSYKQYGSEYILSDYSYQSSFTHQFTAVGPYQLVVTVMDCYGNTATATSNTISINQTGITSLIADINNAKNGDTVIITPTVVNEASIVTSEHYTYTVTKNNVTQEFKANSDKTFKWIPTESGEYTIGLKITYNNTLLASKLMSYTVEQKYEYPITIYYNGFDTPYINFQIGDGEWTLDNGYAMITTDEMEGYTHKYTIELGSDSTYANISFNDGNGNIDNNNGNNYTVEYGQFYKYDNGILTPYYPSKTIKSFNVTTDDGVFSVGDEINMSLEMMNSSEYYEVRYSYIDSNNQKTVFDSYYFTPNLNKFHGTISKAGEYTILVEVRISSYDSEIVYDKKTITVIE